jgi:hypothetical protein
MKEICERTGYLPTKTDRVTTHYGLRHGINLMAQAGYFREHDTCMSQKRQYECSSRAMAQQSGVVLGVCSSVVTLKSPRIPTGPLDARLSQE